MCRCNDVASYYTVNPEGLLQNVIIDWEMKTKTGAIYSGDARDSGPASVAPNADPYSGSGGSFGSNKFSEAAPDGVSNKNIATTVYLPSASTASKASHLI